MRDTIRETIDRYPALSNLLRGARDLLDRNEPALQTPWGFKLAGHPHMASGRFEPEETEVVRTLLAEVEVVVNVGANIGYYCCHALALDKAVVAIEPNGRNLHYLLENLRVNGWESRAEVFPVGCGSSTSVLDMWGRGGGASLVKGWASNPETYKNPVPVLALDRVVGSRIQGKRALVIVDVEGAEWMVVQGASATLANEPRPIWMMEVYTDHQPNQPEGARLHEHFPKVFGAFFAAGYRAFSADSQMEEITAQDVEAAVRGARKIAAHNFIFR